MEKKLLIILLRVFSFGTVVMVARLCRFIWNRIYSGVDIREEDIERFQQAIREGTPILVPSHRSHLIICSFLVSF